MNRDPSPGSGSGPAGSGSGPGSHPGQGSGAAGSGSGPGSHPGQGSGAAGSGSGPGSRSGQGSGAAGSGPPASGLAGGGSSAFPSGHEDAPGSGHAFGPASGRAPNRNSNRTPNGNPLRDRAAICGAGWTGYSKNSGVSTLTLALRAISAALADAGLRASDVDGVATHRVGDSVPAVVVAHSLGIPELRYHLDMFGGGGTSHQVVAHAAMAVATGQADVVVCWRAVNARSEFRMGGTGRAVPDTVEFQYQAPYGYATPPQQFAMMARAWMDARGVRAEDLGRVAVAQRAFARLNERAMMRTSLTLDDYLAARPIAEPLRLYDCCLETDAAVALVVTRADRARDLARPPVLVRAAVTGGGRTLYSAGRPDLAESAAVALAPRLYAAAGAGPEDVDVALLYDAFSFLVPMQLEDYGLVPRGETPGFYADGHPAPGGRLPVNTHGGHLSEGYVHGLNHVAEAVVQLRGDAGPRQAPGARIALSAGQPGHVAGTSAALILRRDA